MTALPIPESASYPAEMLNPLPTDEFILTSREALVAVDGLPPIRQFEARLTDEDLPVTLHELAKITTHGAGAEQAEETFLLATRGFDRHGKPTGIMVIKPTVESSVEDGTIEVVRNTQYFDIGSAPGITTRDGELSFATETSRFDKTIRINWRPKPSRVNDQEPAASIEVASDARARQMSMFNADDSEFRHSRLMNFGKKVTVGLGILATVKGGGLVDRAIDPFQDAGAIVHERLVDDPIVPASVNGVQFEELPADVQQSFNEGARVRDTAALEAVTRTMRDLDEHDTAAIQARADAFRAEHAGEIISEQRKAELLEQLERSETTQASAAVLNEFMQFYGKSAELARDGLGLNDEGFDAYDGQNISNADLQHLAHEVIEAYAPMPRPVLEAAGFSSIRLVALETFSSKVASYQGYGNIDARGAIYMPVASAAQRAMITSTDVLSRALGMDAKVSKIIWHETGHAAANGPEDSEETYGNLPGFMGRLVLGIPNYVSVYAAYGGEQENNAETYARVTDVSEGLIHPDNARQFWSESNHRLLAAMADLEIRHSGITDYLVSLNPNLMQKL